MRSLPRSTERARAFLLGFDLSLLVPHPTRPSVKAFRRSRKVARGKHSNFMQMALILSCAKLREDFGVKAFREWLLSLKDSFRGSILDLNSE